MRTTGTVIYTVLAIIFGFLAFVSFTLRGMGNADTTGAADPGSVAIAIVSAIICLVCIWRLRKIMRENKQGE